MTRASSVNEYIDQAPEAGRDRLKQLRSILRTAAPGATETLKWGKPVFEMGTILFAYSAHKTHLTFVPTGPALKPFESELKGYHVNKDSIQLPYDQPLPEDLIKRIAEYRVMEVVEKNAPWRY